MDVYNACNNGPLSICVQPSLQGTISAPASFLLKVKWAEQAVCCQLIFLKP